MAENSSNFAKITRIYLALIGTSIFNNFSAASAKCIVLDSLEQRNLVYQNMVPGVCFCSISFSVPLCSKPICGSAFSTTSPSNSILILIHHELLGVGQSLNWLVFLPSFQFIYFFNIFSSSQGLSKSKFL